MGEEASCLQRMHQESWLVNVEGTELEEKKNQHSAIIRVKIGSGENYQKDSKSRGILTGKQYICKVLKCSFTDCKEKSNHIVKRLNHGLAGPLKLVSPMGADKHHVILKVTP